MFQAEELQKLDKNYFEVIRADDEVDVTVISKNTRHIWLIHNAGYPMEESCVVFHAHLPACPIINMVGQTPWDRR